VCAPVDDRACYTRGVRRLCIAILVVIGTSVVSPAITHAQGAGYQIQTEEEQGGRSGFWTNRAPAKGGAYRWRLLGIGVGLLAITGTGMLLLIRGAKRERDRTARALGDRTRGDQ
jgi:hypothetical protein